MFFKEKISDRLRYLERALLYLKSKENVSLTDLESNYELRSAIKRNFEIAIEAAIDIGEMVLSQEGAKMPETYREIFLKLGELEVLPREFSEKIAPMAGFRNILVHQYGEADLNKLYGFLKGRLDDLEEFIRYVRLYLESSN